MKEIELIGKRKAREKHFLKQNGVIEAQVFDEDIHFLKDGTYEEIDNTLIDIGNYYINKNNAYKVTFAKTSKDELTNISIGDNYIKTKLVNCNLSQLTENITESKLHKNVCYPDIIDNVDLEYNIMPAKVKEAIILKNKAVDLEKLEFSIETNLELELLDRKIVSKSNDKTYFEFDAPYMIDADFKINNDIVYELSKLENNQYLLKLNINKEWLNNEDTKYPVMIDPTITNSGQNNSVYDTQISPGDENEDWNGTASRLRVGMIETTDGYVPMRALFKFSLPTIGTGSQIINATVRLIGYPTYADYTDYDMLTIHQVTKDWNESNARWNNMHDKYNSKVEGIMEARNSYFESENVVHPIMNYADITRLVRKWYTGTPNYGIMLKQNQEKYNPDFIAQFYSRDNDVLGDNPKPILSISYRNQNGLLDYMDYQTQSFSEGRGYVNNYNGNLTTVFDVGSTINGKMPVGLKLVYNTNDVILNKDYGYGLGYKFNLHQTIKEQVIDGQTYLEYCDEDGTLHYFLNQKVSFDDYGYNTIDTENIYYDEDGLDMTITKNSNDYVLKDKSNNTMKFTKNGVKAYLTEIEDVNGNKNTIEYSPENAIVRIIDANGKEITISYGKTTISIISSGRTTVLSYLNNQVYSINGKFGMTKFEYNENNIISKIKDTNGMSISYEYYSQKPYKVKAISEYGVEGTLGEHIEISYGFDSTTIIDSEGYAKNIVFNSQGGIVSISSLKEKDNICNAYGSSEINGTNDGTNPGYNNKLMRTEIPLKYVKNLLSNTSFEENYVPFIESAYMTMSISDKEANTGLKSLKVDSTRENQIFAYNGNLEITKGKYYTFSAYVKSTNKLRLELTYDDKDNQMVSAYSDVIEPSSEFERYDVTIYYPEDALSGLLVRFNIKETGTVYIDDIQLEEGEVANNYNLLENSDFSKGFSDWNSSVTDNGEELPINNYFEVVNVSNGVKALRAKADPVYSTSMSKTFNISGKGGDIFNLSFWYKNDGINSNLSEYYGSRVYVSFNYIDQKDGHCGIPTPMLNPNDDSWQYVSNDFVAEKDYNSITLEFNREFDANDLYITNLNLFKDIGNVYYEYDEFGNVILENNLDNQNSEYDYDKNNQLIAMTNSKGKKFSYEYDNIVTDKVISKMSDLGISNKIKYDQNNNPISIKSLKSNTSGFINEGLYKIRLKGTDKYLRNILNNIKIISEDCNHDVWKLEKVDEYFKIHHSIVIDKYLTIQNGSLILGAENGDNSLFKLKKNKNGSYSIMQKVKLEDSDEIAEEIGKYIKYTDEGIELSEFIEDDYHFEFYFETIYSDLFIENIATYSEDGKSMESIIDSQGGTTLYEVDDNTGLTKSIKDARGNIVNYDYNYQNQITSITSGDRKVLYRYNDKNLLSKIMYGKKEYNLDYDEFLNVKTIKIGDDITLVNNDYNSRGDLKSIVYGNNSSLNYEYDEFYRLKKIIKENDVYNYKYDNNGNLVKILSNNDVVKCTYNLSKMLSEYRFNNFKIKYKYDSSQNITNTKYNIDDINKEIITTYNDDDLITKTTFDNDEINYEYDELGRVKNSNINKLYNMNYEYVSNGKKTTEIINKFTTGNDCYSYKYDKFGNITHIYHNNKLENKYYYNNYNELIEEKNYLLNTIIKYSYDNVGNILSKKIYNLNTYNLIDVKDYKYNNKWEDQLTKYNGVSIDYDAIGNPITIGNDVYLDWINGRQLNTYTDLDNTINYKYNADGIRIGKIINNIETKYYLENNDIIFEKTGNNMLYYIRSTMDDLVGFMYNDDLYYYIKNIHDDIIGILDANLNMVAKYKYDSWGKIIAITNGQGIDVSEDNNHIANINPYRYRSYYYDKETKLYYLNSRYYNPEWCRFINADGHVSTGQGLNGNNMFCYCGNNPVGKSDVNGMFWKALQKTISKVLNKVRKVVSSIFGAGSATKSVIAPAPTAVIPDPWPITLKSGSKTTTVVSKHGNSSKPISVYAEGNVEHPILSSNVGIKINIAKFTLNLSLGVDNTSLSGSIAKKKSTDSFALKLNLSELKLGFESAKTVKWDSSSDETTYTNLSVNGWFLAAAYAFVRTGQPLLAPEYIYGY